MPLTGAMPMPAENAAQVELQQSAKQRLRIERPHLHPFSKRKMREDDGGRFRIQKRYLLVEPGERRGGDDSVVVFDSLGGIERDELPARMAEMIVELPGEDGVVTGAIVLGKVIMISRHDMDRDVELRKELVDRSELFGRPLVAEIAGNQAERGIGRAQLHRLDHPRKKRPACLLQKMQVVDGEKAEPAGRLSALFSGGCVHAERDRRDQDAKLLTTAVKARGGHVGIPRRLRGQCRFRKNRRMTGRRHFFRFQSGRESGLVPR